MCIGKNTKCRSSSQTSGSSPKPSTSLYGLRLSSAWKRVLIQRGRFTDTRVPITDTRVPAKRNFLKKEGTSIKLSRANTHVLIYLVHIYKELYSYLDRFILINHIRSLSNLMVSSNLMSNTTIRLYNNMCYTCDFTEKEQTMRMRSPENFSKMASSG